MSAAEPSRGVTALPGKSQFLPDALQRYVLAHSTPPDTAEQRLIEETTGLGGVAEMQVPAEQGVLLTSLTRALGARNVVEVGTFTGLSSLAIARGLPAGGRLLTCDVSDEWTAVARPHWAAAGVAHRIELRLGPALATLRALPAEPHLDLAFIDADKPGYIGYWDELVPRMRPSGVLLVDNVFFHQRVLEPEPDDANAQAIKAFNDHARADGRVDVSMLPVGDGLTLACRR